MQFSISPGRGSRLPGGRHLSTLAMKTSARLSPISPSSVSSSLPAAPTNGSPCRSSLAPGASPTNIRSASALPAPNTTDVRVAASSAQRVHARASISSSFNASRRSLAVAIAASVVRRRYAVAQRRHRTGTDAHRRTPPSRDRYPARELDRAMNDTPPQRRVAVIGRGRLGSALARGARRRRAARRAASRRRRHARVVILAVPDGAIAPLAAALAPGPGRSATAPARSALDVLAPHAERFSLHPLMTLTAGLGAAASCAAPAPRSPARRRARSRSPRELARARRARAVRRRRRRPRALPRRREHRVELPRDARGDRRAPVRRSVGVERRHAATLARASLENWARSAPSAR